MVWRRIEAEDGVAEESAAKSKADGGWPNSSQPQAPSSDALHLWLSTMWFGAGFGVGDVAGSDYLQACSTEAAEAAAPRRHRRRWQVQTAAL